MLKTPSCVSYVYGIKAERSQLIGRAKLGGGVAGGHLVGGGWELRNSWGGGFQGGRLCASLLCRSTETPSARRRPAAGRGLRRLSMEGAGQGGGFHPSGEEEQTPFLNCKILFRNKIPKTKACECFL